MEQVLVDKWVSALRSGNYKQGYLSLKSRKQYCCLGVLCDILASEGIGEWSEASTNWSGYYSYEGGTSDTGLPGPLLGDIGLTVAVERELMNLNDEALYTFEEIANYIESHITIEKLHE